MDPLPSDPIAFRSKPTPAAVRVDDPFSALDLHRRLVPRPSCTFFLRAAGDALVATGIRPGDLLVVDRSLPARIGDVVVAVVDGDLLVRRFDRYGGRPVLCTDRPDWRPVIMTDEALALWGVVTAVVRELPQSARWMSCPGGPGGDPFGDIQP